MNPARTLILFPCYQWDDFPRTLADRQAAGLLAGWTSLWHPHLLKSSNQLPQWHRADQPPDDWENTLVILPVSSESRFPDQLREKIASGGGKFVACSPTRRELLNELQSTGIIPPPTESDTRCLLEDFFALGFCYLQVQLMTRQLRYSTHLDQAVFEDHLLQAARAYFDHDAALCKQMLHSCFDQLGQERDHFYSHDTHILEVVLIAPSTLGAKLDVELARPQPLNLLLNAELLLKLAEVNPVALTTIKERLKAGTLNIIGGSYSDLPHPLLDADSIRRDLDRGLQTMQKLLDHKPTVFGRYKDGITPHFPSILKRFGFQGCLLFAWESGSYPEATQVKSAWESPDGTAIDTLSGAVVDGASADSFLGMGTKLGQSLDHDHISTIVIAHWPGMCSEFVQDHARIAEYTPALGKWMGVDRYFEITAHPYHQERLTATEFKPNYLTQAVAAIEVDPISSVARYHQAAVHCRQANTIAVLAEQLKSLYERKAPAVTPELEPGQSPKPLSTQLKQDDTIRSIWEKLDRSIQRYSGLPHQAFGETENAISEKVNRTLQELGTLISKGSKSKTPGLLVINPSFVARRLQWHETQGLDCVGNEAALYAQLPSNKGVKTVVDLPPCGYLWSPQCAPYNSPRGKLPRSASLASADGTLGNEFMEVQLDRNTGHLKALHVPKKRGNRLSMQLAMYDPRGGGTSERPYSSMVADRITMLESTSVFGEIVATGGLWYEKEKAAEYQINYRMWRGSRVLQMTVQLDLKRSLLEEPWSSYVGLRTAWANESALLFGSVAGNRQSLPRGRLIAPNYVEIDEVEHRTTLLLGGLAYHRRNNERFMDSLLMVRGETARTFQLGIGIDLPEPTIVSETFLESALKLEGVPGAPVSGPATWFFAVEPVSVLVHFVASLYDSTGVLCGVRLMVREATSKLTSTRIRCLRDVASAYRADQQGNSLGNLTVETDAVLITLSSNEQCFVDVIWAGSDTEKA
jgi:alpha-mannosidase